MRVCVCLLRLQITLELHIGRLAIVVTILPISSDNSKHSQLIMSQPN